MEDAANLDSIPCGVALLDDDALHILLNQAAHQARRMAQTMGLPPSAREDVEQTIRLALLERRRYFDEARGPWIAFAHRIARQPDSVYVMTSGGGNQIGCDNIQKGLLDLIVNDDVPLQGISITQQFVQTLLSPAKAGESKAAYYTPLTLLTKEHHAAKLLTLDQLSITVAILI